MRMNIIVCMKVVPDTESKIQVKDGAVIEEGLKFLINPFDEWGIEEALRIKEKLGGKITLLTVGTERDIEVVKNGLAYGVDDAILLSDPAFEGSDPIGIARILASACKKMECDLIICGREGADYDTGHTGIALAHMLGIPYVSSCVKVETDGKMLRATRQMDGGHEVHEVALPALFTTSVGLNEPRYPSVKGIMLAKKRSVPVWGKDIIEGAVGYEAAKYEYIEFTQPEEKRKSCKYVTGTPEEEIAQLMSLLEKEAKVI